MTPRLSPKTKAPISGTVPLRVTDLFAEIDRLVQQSESHTAHEQASATLA
jgi:hypothetical protein